MNKKNLSSLILLFFCVITTIACKSDKARDISNKAVKQVKVVNSQIHINKINFYFEKCFNGRYN